MKLAEIIERATDFGSFRSSHNFFSFTLKMILYIIPAVIIGHYTDIIIQKSHNHKLLGNNTINYILLQTFIIIVTFYLFILFFKKFLCEFQTSVAGAYFIVLYFAVQMNYTNMIKDYMTS